MSDGPSRVCAIVGAMSMVLLGVGCVAIEAGHEGYWLSSHSSSAMEASILFPPRRVE
jgi:hypothetical protein